MDPIDILTHAGRYLMDQQNIWYDRVPNSHGDLVPGPTFQAVRTLFSLASDLRKERFDKIHPRP